MELRSFSHFHYIHAIKGDLVTKVLNINSRGKPAVVFKRLADIYESIDVKAPKSLPTRWSREGFEGNIQDRYEIKVESSQVLYAERKLFKDETEVSDADSGGDTDGQNSDVEVDSITIKQMMEGCKKRKLRKSKFVDSSKEKLRTDPKQELNHSCLVSDEDDSDLHVALSLWKSKLSKRKKLKTKCEGSRISTSSQCGQISGNSDAINSDQDLLPSSSDLPIPVDIKVETPEIDATEIHATETPEIDVTEIHNTNYINDELPLLCDENISSCLSSEPIVADELIFNRGLTTSKNETQYCVINGACHEYLEVDDPEPLQMEGEPSTEWMNKDNLDIHKPHYSDFAASESMEAQYALSCVPYDSMSEVISLTEEKCSDTCISQSESLHEVICQNNNQDMSEVISLNEEQCCDTYISQGKSFTQEAVCQNNSGVFTHYYGMTNLHSPQLPEMSPAAVACLTENGYEDKDAFYHRKNTSTASIDECNLSPDYGKSISTKPTSDRYLSPDQHLISIDDDSIECPAKEIQPQISNYSDSERYTSPDFHLDDSIDKFNQFEEPKHHPTKLLSTRTTISPTSQERLSKALKSMQLHDKTCGAIPYIKKLKYKVGTAEKCDQMRRVESNTFNEHNIRKSKKRSLHSTSSTNVPSVSTSSTAAVQGCSDSAIAFTQRQMQDIEGVALKLTNQLKSMKAIVEDRLHVEVNKVASFKFNMDEVRTAIANATKVESSARKWLSMMSRDCNRFCKIMKTTENSLTTTQSVINKPKRKITFADEAGGKLCEVRLIEDDVESFVETIPENYAMV